MAIESVAASSVESFTDAIGIDANIYPSTSGSLVSQLDYLGLDQIRVEAPTSTTAAQTFAAIGAAGIKFDMITTTFDLPITQAMLSTMFGYVDQSAPYVQSVEGPNEVQNDPDSYDGMSGEGAFQALQQTIYELVKSDANLTNSSHSTTVLSFSNVPGGNYTSPLAYTDEANYHAYGQPGILPFDVIAPTMDVTNVAPGKPFILTETGETTVPTTQGVSQIQQALYDTDALLDGYLLGNTKTYLFNLQDFNTSSTDTDFSDYYGLYTNSGVIKLAGTAIHDLTSILADPAAGPSSSQATGSLAYAVTGLPGDAHSLLLEKSTGVFDLALWAEDNSLYDKSTGTLGTATESPVTLSFGSAEDVTVFDPITGTAAVQSASAVTSTTVTLGADPLIVQIATPAPAVPTIGSGPDTLALGISEDAYQGNALYTVSVNGTQVGGTLTATALHEEGQSQTIDVLGTFTAGATVGVTFLNDDYGGSEIKDRNLYIDSANIDGTIVSAAARTMLSTGSVGKIEFLGGSLPAITIGSGPQDVQLGIAEDAFKGNAQFTVSIDGNQIGGTLTATAIQSAGQSQLVNVLDTLAPGEHTLSLDFLNDLYTPGVGDRNLCLTSGGGSNIEFGPLGKLTLYSTGTESHQFSVSSSSS